MNSFAKGEDARRVDQSSMVNNKHVVGPLGPSSSSCRSPPVPCLPSFLSSCLRVCDVRCDPRSYATLGMAPLCARAARDLPAGGGPAGGLPPIGGVTHSHLLLLHARCLRLTLAGCALGLRGRVAGRLLGLLLGLLARLVARARLGAALAGDPAVVALRSVR